MSRLRELEALFKQGKLTRREFMSRVAAMGLAAAVSPSLLGSTAHAAETPKQGGRLRIGISGGSTTDSLDPATITDMMMQVVNRQLTNHLVEIDYKNQPIPELAESWEPSKDAKVWVFNLRKGVEFHNGKTMDAEDVIYSINHHRGESSKSAAKGIVDPIVDIKSDGKDKVVFTLQEGNADFPFIISDYHLSIVPADMDWTKGVGTGAYILDSYEPGVRAFVKKNPNYWKAGRGHFDEVETICIVDVNARTNALKTGQIDLMNRCPRKTIHLMEKMPGIQVIRTDGTKHYSMPMLTNTSPYDNNNIRLALKHAIDREQMLKIILRGYGYLGNDHPIGKNQRYFASDLPQRQYDPDKAKFYLKKAGMDPQTFELFTAEGVFDGAVDAAVLYKENASKAGIDIKVNNVPSDGYWSNIWIKKPWVMCFWGGRVTEDWMFSTAYAADAAWNDMLWKHDKFNKLLKEARAELDEKKRGAMYAEMQQIVSNEGGVVIPVFAADLAAASDKLKFDNVASDWELDGFRAPERWWFA